MAYVFHNPYNFVRTANRTEEILQMPFAGDHDPSKQESGENHSRYWHECYTGEIPVRLRTRTPLFITDPGTKTPDPSYRGKNDKDNHYIYKSMENIPATAFKGMLSSAYEIITNSRYRVFSKVQHDKYLGYRHPARAALTPAKIVEKDGEFFAEIYTAAWLPAYNCPAIKKFQNGQFCERATLRKYHYSNGKNQFDFWSVEQIDGVKFEKITQHATPINTADPLNEKIVSGYVVISGHIFNKKHDERFFFEPNGMIPILENVRKRYERLIEDYQYVHREVGGRSLNQPIGNSEHGSHITDPARLKMKDGLFVYVLKNGNSVQAVYPVQISRDLSDATPWSCLDDTLRPALPPKDPGDKELLRNLSPADRLFGWVPQGGKGAWKGKVRIICEPYNREKNNGQEPIEQFEPFPISILGNPKPEQARFYCGDPEGEPQKDRIQKQQATYQKGKRLRGRKVYLHHSLSYLKKEERQSYWDTVDDTGKEYRRFSIAKDGSMTEKSNQNRSIASWIPPKRDFFFKLRFENLTKEELGALLALLGMEKCCFRMGFGKPLGFGSVALSIVWDRDTIPVMKGSDMKARYEKLNSAPSPALTKAEAQRVIQSYQRAMVEAYGDASKLEAGEQDDSPWKKHEFVELIGDQAKTFQKAWREALDAGQDNPPLEALPDRETLLDLYPDLEKELSAMYADVSKALRNRANDDFGWGSLPFIEDFQKSMMGFEEPVCYPRVSFADKQEGFTWFSENEKEVNGSLVTGYSLPKIGKPLEC